jgi:hypothetical protein
VYKCGTISWKLKGVEECLLKVGCSLKVASRTHRATPVIFGGQRQLWTWHKDLSFNEITKKLNSVSYMDLKSDVLMTCLRTSKKCLGHFSRMPRKCLHHKVCVIPQSKASPSLLLFLCLLYPIHVVPSFLEKPNHRICVYLVLNYVDLPLIIYVCVLSVFA